MSTSQNSTPLDRYFAIIEAISGSAVGLSRQDIELTLDIPRTTVIRLINNLLEAKIIRESNRNANTYVPGPRLSKMFNTDRSWLERDVRPIVQHLTKRTSRTAFLSRLVRHKVTSVMREIPASDDLRMASPGYNFPADITATGRVICAYSSVERQGKIFAAIGRHGQHQKHKELFAQVLEKGYAIEKGEHVPNRSSIAVPVFTRDTRDVEFALGLTFPEPDLPQKTIDAFLPPLLEAAGRIGATLRSGVDSQLLSENRTV